MGTRFYLPSGGGYPCSPAYDAGWEDTSAATRRPCDTTTASTVMTVVALYNDAPSSPLDLLAAQFISDPLAAQTISGTVKGQVRCKEYYLCSCCRAIVIKVVSNDGSTVRGTLLSHFPSSLTSEYYYEPIPPNHWQNRYFPPSGTSLNSVTVQDNDRIVIEIGTRSFSAATPIKADQVFGDDSATDLPEDETTTSAYNPWVEFSGTISFYGVGTQRILGGTPAGASSATAKMALGMHLSAAATSIASLVGRVAGSTTCFLSGAVNAITSVLPTVLSKGYKLLAGTVSAITQLVGGGLGTRGRRLLGGIASAASAINTTNITQAFRRLLGGIVATTASLLSTQIEGATSLLTLSSLLSRANIQCRLSPVIDTTMLATLCAQAIQRFCLRSQWLERSTSIALVAGQTQYYLPTDHQVTTSVYYNNYKLLPCTSFDAQLDTLFPLTATLYYEDEWDDLSQGKKSITVGTTPGAGTLTVWYKFTDTMPVLSSDQITWSYALGVCYLMGTMELAMATEDDEYDRYRSWLYGYMAQTMAGQLRELAINRRLR